VYVVSIYLDNEPAPDGWATPALICAAEYDATGPDDRHLKVLLRRLALTYTMDPAKKVKVSIWNEQRQCWHHPAGKRMPESWDGILHMETTVHVGSANL